MTINLNKKELEILIETVGSEIDRHADMLHSWPITPQYDMLVDIFDILVKTAENGN